MSQIDSKPPIWGIAFSTPSPQRFWLRNHHEGPVLTRSADETASPKRRDLVSRRDAQI